MSEQAHELREDELDRIFHALADRTRRSMLAQLRRGSARVTELAKPHAMSLPAISKHLKVLESAGLVERRVDGRVHHCELAAPALQQVEQWLAHYTALWRGSLSALKAYVEEQEARGE